MRITGGEKKGAIIKAPRGLKVRPPTDMIREGVFNVLRDVKGEAILDLFSGSGSFSFEALSRGADLSLCVDIDGEAIRCLMENATKLGYEKRIEVMKMDVLYALKRIERMNKKFTLVFIDPPFDYPEKNVLRVFEELSEILDSTTRIVLRVPVHKKLAIKEPFDINSIKKYGDSQIFFIRKV